jgi:hypothetical protein
MSTIASLPMPLGSKAQRDDTFYDLLAIVNIDLTSGGEVESLRMLVRNQYGEVLTLDGAETRLILPGDALTTGGDR